MMRIAIVSVLFLHTCVAETARAQSLSEILPVNATHCAVTDPPAQAGLAATPGGFVMVFPRTAALTDTFTGCKIMWIVDGSTMRRFATLYFKSGKLAIAASHDPRGEPGAVVAACAYPEGKSLLTKRGQTGAPSCAGVTDEPFYALRLPTWPRLCLTDPKAAVCKAEPSE